MDKLALIRKLQLQPHVEGGYYRRTYNSQHNSGEPQRSLMSSIYYLLTDDSPIGYFHRNQSDIIHYCMPAKHCATGLSTMRVNSAAHNLAPAKISNCNSSSPAVTGRQASLNRVNLACSLKRSLPASISMICSWPNLNKCNRTSPRLSIKSSASSSPEWL